MLLIRLGNLALTLTVLLVHAKLRNGMINEKTDHMLLFTVAFKK